MLWLARKSLKCSICIGLIAASISAAPAFAADPATCTDLQGRYDGTKSAMTAIEVSTTLFSATDRGCTDLVMRLLDNGASFDARDRFGARPLSHAARAGQMAIVDLLLTRGAPIDARNLAGATALFAAIEAGQSDVARKLIDRGADVNLAGRSDLTPLTVAAFKRDDTLVAALLAKKANPAAVDRTGKTAIVYAAVRGALPVVRRLLDQGIDVNARYGNDLTALMWAAGYDENIATADGTRTVAFLLDRGAHIDDRDNRGRSALMIAAEQGHAEVVDLLLSRGADARAKDNAGKMAADLTTSTALKERLMRR